MSTPTVAARILDALAALGVDRVFGLPGVHNLPFWRELGPGRPSIIGVRHEQATVYAADGAARASGGLGVALTTTGPGAANAAGAFGEAWSSCSPVLVIASEIPTRLRKPGSTRRVLHECRDQAAIFEPLAKAVYRPRTPQEVGAAVRDAVTTALAFPRGPVYLDIPTDVLDLPGPQIVIPPGVTRPAPTAEQIAAAAAEIDAAERVIVWAGGGAIQSGASAQVGALARRLCAPVLTTYAGRGVLPADDPYLVGLPPHEPEVAKLLESADLMVAVGSDFDGIATKNWSMPRPPRLVAVNCDPADASKDYQPDVLVVADAATALDELIPAVRARTASWAPELPALRSRIRADIRADSRTTTAMELVEAVEAGWPRDGRIVNDMAIGAYWVNAYADIYGPRRIQCPIGWGTLGYALPAAIGPASDGQGPVLAIVGDGGMMFALGELATIVQERLPITVLVVDDGGYGMLRYDQIHDGDEERGVDLHGPDFAQLAASFGITAIRRDCVDAGLGAVLAECAEAKEPRLVWLRQKLIPPRTTSPRWND
ncbi:thiamine pyrophosphate-binding protein [Dactylosporangium sp. CA-233914]|uniref:thiamine pyrophosphate-binding protein n=1 Tax=Dactylosporangium sp. CA-233914 TaxID=3239934 RepID=UPI003D944955